MFIYRNGFGAVSINVGQRSAFGVFEAQKQAALEKMEFFVRNLVFKEKRKPLPFMRGILCQIRALRCLHEDLKSSGYPVLLTCRTNQDCVENIFSCFRGMSAGPNDHPDQLQVGACKDKVILFFSMK